MTLAELKILITGDDSGASDALERTSDALKAAEQAAQALSDKLAELRETTALGADASDRQVAIYEAMTGRFGDARTAVLQLNAAYDALESRLKSDEGWQRFSAAMQDAKQRIAEAALQSRDDRNAFETFGKTFSDLSPKVQAFVSELGRAQIEAEKLEKLQPTGLGAAIAQAPQLKEEAEDAAARQKAFNDEAARQIAWNQRLIELGGKATQVERQLWEVQEGRFKSVDSGLKQTLESQARLLEQAGSQTALEEALGKAQLEHAKLTATTTQEKVAIDVLGKAYDQLGDTQREIVKDSIAPLIDANRELSDEQRRQAQIASELNRVLARQYSDIAKAGADLGPLDAALKDLAVDTPNLTPENQKLLEQIRRMQPAVEAFKALSKGVIGLFDNVFNDLFEHGFKGFFSNVTSGFRKMVAEMAQEWTRLQLTKSIQRGLGGLFGADSALGSLGFGESDAFDEFLGGGFDTGSLAGALDLFGRASGGPVDAGTPYLVGEDGPEVFVPLGSGTIIPQAAMSAAQVSPASGSGLVVHNHFQIHTPSPAAFRQSMGQIASETGRSIQKSLRRNS